MSTAPAWMAILGMAAVTYLTRIAGLLFAHRLDLPPRAKAPSIRRRLM